MCTTSQKDNSDPVIDEEPAELTRTVILYKNSDVISRLKDSNLRVAIYACVDPEILGRLALGFPECFGADPSVFKSVPQQIIIDCGQQHKEDHYPNDLFFTWAEDLKLPIVARYWEDGEDSDIPKSELDQIMKQLIGKPLKPLREVTFREMNCVVVGLCAEAWSPSEGESIPENLKVWSLFLGHSDSVK